MKAVRTVSKDSRPTPRPALDPEAREDQMISYAVDLAEKQLREGTASSQVITHYLKRSCSKEKERLENEKLELEKELLKAKTEALQSQKHVEELYANAISAMQLYAGRTINEDI